MHFALATGRTDRETDATTSVTIVYVVETSFNGDVKNRKAIVKTVAMAQWQVSDLMSPDMQKLIVHLIIKVISLFFVS